MSEILEKETKKTSKEFSSWMIEMPSDIAKQEGYADGSKVVLTFQNGSIKPEILPPTSAEVKKEVGRIIEKYDKSFEDLKRFGD